MLWNASENDRMLLSLATALGLDHDVFVFSICDHDPFVAIREPFTRLSLPSLSDALDAMLSCALDVVLLSDASPFVTSIQTPTVLIADSKDTSSQALSLASKVAAVSWPLAESVSRASLRSDVLVIPPAPLSSLSQSFKPHEAVLLVCDWSEDSGVVDACSLRRRARFEANLTVAAPPRTPGQDESLRKFVAATPGVTVVDLPTSPNAWVSLVASHKVLLTPALGQLITEHGSNCLVGVVDLDVVNHSLALAKCQLALLDQREVKVRLQLVVLVSGVAQVLGEVDVLRRKDWGEVKTICLVVRDGSVDIQ